MTKKQKITLVSVFAAIVVIAAVLAGALLQLVCYLGGGHAVLAGKRFDGGS